MPTIQLPLIANRSSVTFTLVMTPQSISAVTGAATDTTPVITATAVMQSITYDRSKTLTEISAMTALMENYVVTKSTFSFSLRLFLTSIEVLGDSLDGALESKDYWKIVWVYGGKTRTLDVCILENHNVQADGSGGVFLDATFRPVGLEDTLA